MGNVVSDGRRHTMMELTEVPGNSARTQTQTWASKSKRMPRSRKTLNSGNLGNSSEFLFCVVFLIFVPAAETWNNLRRVLNLKPVICLFNSLKDQMAIPLSSLWTHTVWNKLSCSSPTDRRQRQIFCDVLLSYGFLGGEQQWINVLKSFKLWLVYSLYHIPTEKEQTLLMYTKNYNSTASHLLHLRWTVHLNILYTNPAGLAEITSPE